MTLAGAWPWLIFAAIVGVIICVVIVVIVLRAAKAKVPMVPADSVAPPGAPDEPKKTIAHDSGVTAALGVRKSFADANRVMKTHTSRASERLAMPWVLSMGEAGAGKSTMLGALTLPRMSRSGASDDSIHESACSWNFFEHGVVIDVAGSLVLDPVRHRADDRAWNAVVNQLQRHRPERPLDAVVLSIPAADLVGPDRLSREALGQKAAHVGDRLAELQHVLSLRLPVYIVITKCDVIPGFAAFARALPSKRLDDMVGWSSPYTVDTAFVPGWVDEALDSVLRGIQEAEFAALAREEGVPLEGDELFLLPQHLGRARSPLREYLQRIFRPTTYERGAFLRGIYFTGDRNARVPSGGDLTAAMPRMARPTVELAPDAWLSAADFAPAPRVEAAPTTGRHPVFLGDLFGEKIFAERGLAQPGPRVFPSKNKVVARMQIAAAAILIVGPFALYGAANGIRIGPWRVSQGIKAQSATIKPLLQNIDLAVRQMEARRKMFHSASNEGSEPEVSVFHLLGDMARMSSSHLWSPLLPGTLLSPLHRDITDAIGLSFQTIILPEFRDRLIYRAKRLLNPANTAPVPDDAQYGVGLSLPQYLSEVVSLGSSVQRFDNLAKKDNGDLEDLAEIVKFLYGEEMSPDFLANSGYYRQALNEAQAQPIPVDSAARYRALQRAGELAHTSYLALLQRLNGAQVSGDSVNAGRDAAADVEALVGLRAFLDTAGPVEHALASIPPGFVFGDVFAAQVRDTLRFYKLQLTGDVLPRYADASHSPDAVIGAIDNLLRQSFMQAPASQTLADDGGAGAELSWDTARLDDAIGIRKAFDTFMAHGLDPLPETLRNRVRRLATVQVAAAMTDAIASAAHVRPASTTLADRDQDLAARVGEFEQSAPRVSQLLDMLDGMGATTTYDALFDVSTINASALLARVDAAVDLTNRYRLPPAAVAAWNGHAPFSTNGFGGRPGALDEYFAGEQDVLVTNAKLAQPLVTFLRGHDDQSGPTSGSLRNWDAILSAVDKLDRKPPSGPIVSMETTLRFELDSLDLADCAKRAPRSTPGGDLFTERADGIWSSVWRRCVDLGSRELVAAYGRLETQFHSRLAGRFPFSAPDAPTEASGADIADFLRNYDAFAAVAKQTGGTDDATDILGARTATFLSDMAHVRTFFGAYLDSAAAGRLPTFDYQIDFRVNRARESGANQIAEWSADIADQLAEMGAPVATRRGRWRAGDDIETSLRWATGSPLVPADPAPPGASLGDASISFTSSGQWSLLRFLKEYESDTSDPDGGQTLKFSVRTGRRGSSAEATNTARAYLRVRLYNPDTKAELVVPHFPVAAPDAGTGGRP
ncbi:MAG TPA: type VI secretion system protein [Gemmatimonadaceae bacterium]|jgi:type VI secretion system protein ImpL